uniref:uncharacterized mitochondrial protein AtMg00820-like n=1 Tax=Osmia lignaria TaxID=473952 RepID=UPI00147855DC|nr:uncharacterized mitochondrial protein AtMg00820-like [Osmia lignaria]
MKRKKNKMHNHQTLMTEDNRRKTRRRKKLKSANVPENYDEVITCPESKRWMKAMKEEIGSLEENNTWSLVDEPVNEKIIEVKWIYQIKSDGKYKVHVVTKGFQQPYQEKEDSPVARTNTLKLLLLVACING